MEELIARAPEIPVAKGMAFYESCPKDNVRLEFDPYAPSSHICPKCGQDWQGKTFDLAWVRQFQDWLGKRLAEAGILYQVEGDERFARLVRDSLDHFVRRYRDYPLANNLLGPTRLFQSTYLEAFWLVDIVTAYDLTRASGAYSETDHSGVRDLLFESCSVVRSFDEGVSNRQAFNNAGMGAVALLYQDEALLEHVLDGPHGFRFHMRESLLEDGIWYEGETYHFATLDHLLDLAEMARHRGIDLYEDASSYGSLRSMFAGPLKVMLPDLTFPSRKDSWFGRGIGYHREIYEIGYARYGDARYGGLLAHAYQNGADRRDLGWRSFLYLEPDLPELNADALRPEECEPMPGTGVAVLRRDSGRVYASLEYGHYGGGHGHPDRLHLSLFANGVHWLLDPGTGWYHVPELGWYRSTVAHNTVTVDGRLQTPSEGELLAFGDAGGFQVVQARVEGASPHITMRRTLCLGEGFLFDAFELEGQEPHTYDWAFHTPARLQTELKGKKASPGMRDGYEFLQDPVALETPHLDITVSAEGRVLRTVQLGNAQRYLAQAPGIPLQEVSLNTLISRRRAENTCFVTVYLWGDEAGEAQLKAEGPRHYRLECEDSIYHFELGQESGLAVATEGSGELERLAWFARRDVVLPGATVTADHLLPYGAFERAGEGWLAQLPSNFGRVRLEATLVGQILGLPEGACWHLEKNTLMLQQSPGLVLELEQDKPLTLFAGCENALVFCLRFYGLPALRPELEIPEGWRLSGLENDGPDRWRAALILSAEPQDRKGEVVVMAGNHTFTVPYRVEPPVISSWQVSTLKGSPQIVLEVRDQTGLGGTLKSEVFAPWLLAEPYLSVLELEPGGTLSVRLPLPLQACEPMPSPPPPSKAWELPGLSGNAGLYELLATLTFAEFQGVSRACLPLCWATADERGSTFNLDRLEQASWAERPWGGAADASAQASLAWNAKGIWLISEVRDDRHVHDANEDDLYENDSLQVYFDFRPHRDPNFAPGVAAYILAPAADKRSLRIEAIAGNREISNRGAEPEWFTTDGIETAVEPTPGGYRLTAFFPYHSLGAPPLEGGEVVGFDLALSDNDGTWYRNTLLVWSGARGRRLYIRGSYHNPTQFGYLIADRKMLQ